MYDLNPMSLKGSRARSQARKERLAREVQTEHVLESLHIPKSANTDRVLNTLHVPHKAHAKPAAPTSHKANLWWKKHKSKVSVACLVIAASAALTLGVLAHG